MQVATISFADKVRVDTARLNAICDQMGRQKGEDAICVAMEDLAALLHSATQAWKQCDMDALEPTARQVSGIADRIGLVTLAAAAGDVSALCASHDDAALAATMARMTRLGEGSLIAIWEAQELSV